MNDEQATETVSPPRDLDELIERLAPRLAASPYEYLLVITRDDDSGVRDGSHGGDPLRASSEGRVMNSAFSLAIIDPSKEFARNSMTVILPTVNGVYINCDGTNTIDHAPVGISLLGLSRMRETLIESAVGFEPIRVPSFEIAIGNAEVVKALERVRNKRDLVAIATAARKLGQPIVGSPALTAAVKENAASLVGTLVRTVFGPKPKSVPESEVAEYLAALEALGIDGAAAAQRCLAQLLVELKIGLKLET